jgi:hypothetical protein
MGSLFSEKFRYLRNYTTAQKIVNKKDCAFNAPSLASSKIKYFSSALDFIDNENYLCLKGKDKIIHHLELITHNYSQPPTRFVL